jgi:hypothetical protein
MSSKYLTILSVLAPFEVNGVRESSRIFSDLEEELLDLARLRNIGVGFSEFKQENSFIDLTFNKTSAFMIELSSISKLAIFSWLAM